MEKIIQGLGRQIEEALSLGEKFQLPEQYRSMSNVVYSGMGGSAIGGDILALLDWHEAKVPFHVNRFMRLPAWTDEKTLLILCSYSGNTAETLQAFDEGLQRKAKMFVITAGGELAQRAENKNIPMLRIPNSLPPRCAIGYITFSGMPALAKLGYFKLGKKDFDEVQQVIQKVSRPAAKDLAKKIHNRSVHLYGVAGFAEPVLVRWRAQFAENSKALASSHLMPEMLHNEIEGWHYPEDLIRKSSAVFLFDTQTPAWLQKKVAALRQYIEDVGGQTLEATAQGQSLLARLFSLIVFGDWTSYELALLNHVDPLSIRAIETIKKIK